MRFPSFNAALLVVLVISTLVATHIYLLQETDQELEKEQQLLKEVSGEIHKTTVPKVANDKLAANQLANSALPNRSCSSQSWYTWFPANYTRLIVQDPKFRVSLHNQKIDPARPMVHYGLWKILRTRFSKNMERSPSGR
jgi:hypothetical protein